MRHILLLRVPLLLMVTLVSGAIQYGCAQPHVSDINRAQESGDQLTVGKVQSEIRVGMSGGEVVSVLGSPNIVTTDELRREVWVYDRASKVSAVSKSSTGLLGWILLGVASGGAESSSQRTLTIIVKFDEEKKVRDLAYHSSSF